MRNRRYILCSGLAFADEEDMQMLHEYAENGWIFKELRFGMVYVLYREEPQDLVFSYDLRKVKKEDKDDYLAIFEEAGWKSIPKWNQDTHFFYAKKGTVPLHSEEDTRNEQYRPTLISALMILLVGIVLLVLALCLHLEYLAPVAGACIGGGGLMCIGCYLRVKGKRLNLNPNTYAYQLLKLVIGLGLLSMFFKVEQKIDLYYLLLIVIVLWLIFGSIYGCYRAYLHKRRK